MKIQRLLLISLVLALFWGCAGPQTPEQGKQMGYFFGPLLSDDENFPEKLAKAGQMDGLQNQARQLGVDLSKLPADWMPDGQSDIRFEIWPDGRVCYWFNSDALVWDDPKARKFATKEWGLLEDQARQCGVSLEDIPADWHPNGEVPVSIKKRPDGTIHYVRGDDYLVWNRSSRKWQNAD